MISDSSCCQSSIWRDRMAGFTC